MQTFEKRTAVPATATELFDWHARDGAFERLNPPFDPVIIEERGQGLGVGSRAVVRMKLGPIEQRLIAVHTACEPGVMFKDEQQQGPFAKWEHTHRFFDGELFDHIDYQLPMGGLGQAVAGHFSEQQIERLFNYRHALTRADLERHAKFKDRPRLTVAITGATGLIGSSLAAYLSTAGHTVRPVKRGDFSAVDGADAVVHLAGANIGQRWSKQHRIDIATSRIDYTRALVEAIAQAKNPPRVLLSGSAVGIYGDRGDEAMTEASAPGTPADQGSGFLVALCQQWEAEAAKATAQRVVLLRTGVVITARGGALAQMLPAFRAGGGGPLGSGQQQTSWISLEDVLGAIEHALFTESIVGPMNLTAPTPVTNAELSHTLGRVLSRPSVMKVPKFALRLLFGEAADAAFLASQKATPAVLLASGFQFLQPDLEQCLRFTLGK